jgi:hypothetical protein
MKTIIALLVYVATIGVLAAPIDVGVKTARTYQTMTDGLTNRTTALYNRRKIRTHVGGVIT